MEASATTTGIVRMDSTEDCAASSEPRAVSLPYLAAYIAVLVAVGADAEIAIADRSGPLTPQR